MPATRARPWASACADLGLRHGDRRRRPGPRQSGRARDRARPGAGPCSTNCVVVDVDLQDRAGHPRGDVGHMAGHVGVVGADRGEGLDDPRPEPEGGPDQPGGHERAERRSRRGPRLGGRGWGAVGMGLDRRRARFVDDCFGLRLGSRVGRRLRRVDPCGRWARVRVPRPTAWFPALVQAGPAASSPSIRGRRRPAMGADPTRTVSRPGAGQARQAPGCSPGVPQAPVIARLGEEKRGCVGGSRSLIG